MRAIFLLCVFALLGSVFGINPKIKSCDDCTSISDCKAANALILKYELEADDQLKEAFCGFDNDKFPKVCCSMLSNGEPSDPTPASVSIEDHPNLRLLPEPCSENIPDKLLSGHAHLYEYPWMALISYSTREGLNFECSGSLINERYVLTAGHCISTAIVGVRIGEFDLDTITDCEGTVCADHYQDLRLEEAIAHPSYQGITNFKHDIGLIRLEKPVDLTSKNAKTICLPVTKALQDRNVTGLFAIIAGWDFTYSTPLYSKSSRLQDSAIPIHSKDNCSAAFHEHLRQPEDIFDFTDKLCAGGYGRTTDNIGDGPLMVSGSHNGVNRFIQHGIFSSQISSPSAPAVYTDVSKYMPWILDTIKP